MKSSLRGPIGRGLLAVCALGGGLIGCGDGPICESEKLVIIRSPQGPIIADSDPRTPGVQSDVAVRSTFGKDAEMILTVLDSADMVTASMSARTDSDGNVTFSDVTIPPAGGTLRVKGDSGMCGSDEDEVSVSIVGGGDCSIEFSTAPMDNPFYAPLAVWNVDSDANDMTPGFQGDAIIHARPGEQVKLFLSAPGLTEMEIAAGTIGNAGTVSLAMSTPEGQVNLRAECGVAASVGTRSSGVSSVFVDTVAPTCRFVDPTPGTSITPGMDSNSDLADGIQLVLRANASGGDGAGDAASFVLTAPGGGATAFVGTDLSATGDSTTDATFNPATSPANYTARFDTTDHAGNSCSVAQPYRVVLAGCELTVVAPTGTVTVDADGNPANGAQIEIRVVSNCLGQTVTSDCGSNDPGATVPPGSAFSLFATVCGGVPCEASEMCTLRVTSTDGIETTAGASLSFDNQPPSVSVGVSLPLGVACGGTVTPAQDIDLATAGTQIRMRVTAPSAISRELQISNGSVSQVVPVTAPGGEVVVTIDPGTNTFLGRATDAAGNIGMSTTCTVGLADIAVNFTGSPADGTVGSVDGTVTGSSLTFNITGTVSVTGASVNVTVNGGSPTAATVTGTTWSATVTLVDSTMAYTIVATATQGPRTGSATLPLIVDLTGPGAPSGLTAVADTRQSIRLNFTAPAGAATYRVKFATVALTDGNFDTTGTVAAAPTPGAAGTADVVRARPLRAGTPYWVGIAAVDGAGNRSIAQIAGPLTPRFDQAAVVAAPNTSGNAALGLAVVHGRFNDDGFDDVAIGAPYVTSGGLSAAGEVYVYLGSATGLATAPALTIRGEVADGNFGGALTAVQWSSSTRSDLVVGAPGAEGFNGLIYMWNGGAALPTGSISAATAPRKIGVATTANWFSGSALGWQLAAADHDGDGIDDLISTAVFGNAGASGAAVVFYGGTVPSGLVRISDVSAASSGTAVIRMYEDPDATGSLFGYYLHNVGATGVSDSTDDLVVGYAEDGLVNGTVIVYRGQGRPAAPGVTRAAFTIGRDVRVRFSVIDTVLEWGSTVGSIPDRNGNGTRELVFGDYRYNADAGIVQIVDGGVVGTVGTHLVDATGVGAIATYVGTNSSDQLGMSIVNNANTAGPDVDGDGVEDLIVAGRAPGTTQAVLDVWFGPVPIGAASPAPNHVISGPASFHGNVPGIGGSAITAIWAGDVNADGLDDVCWADWTSNSLDGGFQMLWDDGN